MTFLVGNELRKDLRKWVAPPDPSVNYNVTTRAHHEGTAAWCTGGNKVADWKSSGSLLWIHGKRTYLITVLVLLPLTTPGLIAGSGKSVLRCVIPRLTRPDRTYVTDKLCDHPGHQIHIQIWVGFLGVFLLRLQRQSKTGLPRFIIIPSYPTLRAIRYILRRSFLLLLRTQSRIGTANRRLACGVP